MSNAYLSQIERGLHAPSVRVLRSIAKALDLSAEAMLAQAGLFEDDAAADDAVRRQPPATEAAIRRDPKLTSDQKEALLSVYRSYLAVNRGGPDVRCLTPEDARPRQRAAEAAHSARPTPWGRRRGCWPGSTPRGFAEALEEVAAALLPRAPAGRGRPPAATPPPWCRAGWAVVGPVDGRARRRARWSPSPATAASATRPGRATPASSGSGRPTWRGGGTSTSWSTRPASTPAPRPRPASPSASLVDAMAPTNFLLDQPGRPAPGVRDRRPLGDRGAGATSSATSRPTAAGRARSTRRPSGWGRTWPPRRARSCSATT